MSEQQTSYRQKQLATIKFERDKIKSLLPHLYSFEWYDWALQFFDSTNPMNLLCAGNQLSKSSTQIRKCIHWATSPKLQKSLWATPPRMFWYLYPSKDVATVEFEKKWVPEFLPRPPYDKHPIYGWKANYKDKHIYSIDFNTGVTIYFKTYSQDPQKLQSGTVHAIFTDEELPVGLLDELIFRLQAVAGYFHMVFTATIGQELWYKAIERIGKKDEAFREAAKWQISMYDCQKYANGKPSPWTHERIKAVEAMCPTVAAINKRVHGRFVQEEGLRYESYNSSKNRITVQDFCNRYKTNKNNLIPHGWDTFGAVDIGSGGPTGHPAATIMVAVRPDYKYGIAFRGWRGNKSQRTTSSDILEKYRTVRGRYTPIAQYYDWASADFFTFASGLGETFLKADKGEIGYETLNTLFKNEMFDVLDIGELDDLSFELSNIRVTTSKQNAEDDFSDALRYATSSIPWDYTGITDKFITARGTPPTGPKTEAQLRREMVFGEDDAPDPIREEIEDEIEYYNEMY